MRGKQRERYMIDSAHGITPADAGKTNSYIARCKLQWDHPRGCGENTKKIL